MAALTFADLQTEVFDQTGLDSADTNNQTRVQRWLNLIQQDICARWPWNFLRSRETIVTVVDKIAGTVSVNAGGTTVTGVGTAFTNGSTWLSGGSYGDIGNYIQFAGANDWYAISAVGGATGLTITPAFAGTTNLSGVKYTLRKFFYSMSSSCDRICDVKNWNTPLKLDELFPRDVDFVQPNPQSSNTSYGFIPYGYDPVGNVQIIPYPFPSDARLFEIKTFKRPTDMTGTALPTLPNKWSHVIAFGACALGFLYLRKPDISQMWETLFEKKIEDMMAQERTSEDSSPILESIDSGHGSTENWLQFPDNYPLPQGRP
jgi:hypothetical protein